MLECTFSRYCSCGNDIQERAVDTEKSLCSSPQWGRDGTAPLSFLLNATDNTQDFITERAVSKELDSALLGPICATTPQTHSLDDEILYDFIDPALLLPSQGYQALPAQVEDQGVLSTLLSTPSHGDKLADRISSLTSHLTAYAASHDLAFDSTSFRRFCSVSNVYEFATTFCRKRHFWYPVIHWPTFTLEEATLPLLLVVSLTGATYSYHSDSQSRHVRNARNLYPLADAFVFEQLSTCLKGRKDMTETIQLCQAALLMYGLDILLTGDAEMQHTAIAQRLPALVSAIRSLRLIGTRHGNSEDWRLFVQRESLLRLASWTFCTDCLITLSYNHPPLFSMLEMTGDLPCDPDLWDAESAAAFEQLRSKRTQHPSHSLKDLLSAFVKAELHPDIDLGNLSPFHLHMILCAFQPLIFNLDVASSARTELTNLLQVLSAWRCLWDNAIGRFTDADRSRLGVTKYVPGLEYLSRRVIEVAVSQDRSHLHSRYLQRIPSYDTSEIHAFMRDFVAKR